MQKKPQFKHEKLEFAVYRPYVPLLTDCFLQSYKNPKKFQKFYKVNFFARTAAIHDSFYYGKEARDFGRVMFARESEYFGVPDIPRIKRMPGNTLATFKRIYKYGEKLLKFSWQINKTDFSKHSEKQLLAFFRKFIDNKITFSTALMGFNIQFIVEEKIRALFADDPNQDELVATITFPDKQNIAALEIIDLLRLRMVLDAARIKKFEEVGPKEMRLLEQHVKNYGWINARSSTSQAWDEQEIFARAMAENNCGKRLQDFADNAAVHKKQSAELLRKMKADKNIKYLVAVAKELVYFRTYRTDYLNWIFFNARPLMTALALKRGIAYTDIVQYLIQEILENKKVSKKEIERRKQGFALMLLEPHKLMFSSDPKKKDFWKSKHVEAAESGASEVRGAAAYRGLVKGMVRVVKSKEDILSFKVGEVLVASMTTPNMIQIMQKAAAFVTDEGGITCHAAIVARELKKPCVIGTKFATQVFKNGDMVEVDANKGVVKKIK